jgi:uncharacterized protein YcfL
MTRFSILSSVLALAGSSLMLVSCNNCETCLQYKVPMNGTGEEFLMEQEVCGNQDVTDKEDETIDNVSFEGDTVLYQTYWRCSESLDN